MLRLNNAVMEVTSKKKETHIYLVMIIGHLNLEATLVLKQENLTEGHINPSDHILPCKYPVICFASHVIITENFPVQ